MSLTPHQLKRVHRIWAAITVLAIFCITGLELAALYLGADPSGLPVAIALIAALAGAGVGRFTR